MKNQISWIREAGLLLAVLLLTSGCLQQVSEPAQQSEAPADSNPVASALSVNDADSSLDTEPMADADMFADDISEQGDVSDAAAVAVSDELVVPANLHPGPGLIQVIKLANSGVEESVLLAYASNSPDRFDLGSNEIIYLNDIGIPSRVITAMLQRDHILQAIAAMPPAWDEPMPVAATETDSSGTEPAASLDFAVGLPPASYPAPDDSIQPSQPVPPTTAPLFYDALAPYGSWVDVDGYGRCWQPTVVVQDPDWQPYLDQGRWVYTDCGWYWKSDYSWGWAAFHYGRWFRHARMGWCWCPDDVWAPSWVSWRTSNDYCGWAPLPPGAGFNVAGELCWHGRPCGTNFNFNLGSASFRFVASHDFCDNHLSHRVIPRAKAPRIFHHTMVSNPASGSNHVVSNNGMARNHIAAAIGHEVPRVTLRQTDPGATHATRDRFESNGKVLAIYHARIGGSLVGSLGQSQPANRLQPEGQSLAAGGASSARDGTVIAPRRPAIQPGSASLRPSGQPVPPLILHGSDFRGGGQTVAGSSTHSHDAAGSAGPAHSGAANIRGISNPAPGAPAISSGSSLMIIGHRGGSHDAAQSHGSIKVFSTPAAAPAVAQAQQAARDSAAQRVAYTYSQQQQPNANPATETVPWWLTRATPSQRPANREDNYSGHQARPEPRQHFDQGYGTRAETPPGSAPSYHPAYHESPAASAPVHSQASQPRSETHTTPPPPQAVSSPPAAPAQAPAASSHTSAATQSSSSGGSRR
jgi:hypothetical protein